MSNDKEKTKKMYFDYFCNKTWMERDGVLGKYNSFRVSDAEEQMWRREYILLYVNRLSLDDLTALDMLWSATAWEALPDLISRASQTDGFARMYYANTIWDLATEAVASSIRDEAVKTAFSLWQSLAEGLMELTQDDKAEVTPRMMQAMNAATPEVYLSNWAKSKIAWAKRFRFYSGTT